MPRHRQEFDICCKIKVASHGHYFGCFHLQQCWHDLYQQIVSCWEHNTNTANTLIPDVLRGMEPVTNDTIFISYGHGQKRGHLDIPKHTLKLFVLVALRDGVCFLSAGTCFIPDVALLGPMVWPVLSCLKNTLDSPWNCVLSGFGCVSCCLGPVGCETPCLGCRAVLISPGKEFWSLESSEQSECYY